MKIIKIWADIDSTGIFDEEGNMLLKDETTISNATWIELQKWVKDYEFVIPMSFDNRRVIQDKIISLDNIGLQLLNKLQSEWRRDIQSNKEIHFKYYSEGLMKFIV